MFWWIFVIYFSFCATLLWLLMWNILNAIWKSIFGSFIFPLQKFNWKNKTFTYDHYNSCAQLFGASITLLQLLILLMLYFFIYIEASIGVLYRSLLELLEHPSINRISKKNFLWNIGKLPSKTFILQSFIQVHLQAFLVCERPLALKGSLLF